MPLILHQGCALRCSHCDGAITVANPRNTTLRANAAGHLALVREDTFTVVPMPGRCPGMLSPPQGPPCDAVRFVGASVSAKIRVGQWHVLTQDMSGSTVGIAPPPVAPEADPPPLVVDHGQVAITPSATRLEQR